MADDVLITETPVPSALDDADWGRDVPPSGKPPATPAPVAEPEVDESAVLARQRGWVPESEWTGRKDRWKDASAYNDQYESVMPFVQRENKKLAQELREARTQLQDLSKKSGDWEKFQAEQKEAQGKLRVETLRMERKTAIENSDTDALIRIDDELMDLRVASAAAPASRQVTAAQVDPIVKRTLEDFIGDNPTFKDPKMGAVLSEQATLMRASGSQLMGREFLDEAMERVQRLYPERFRNGSATPAPSRRHPLGEMGGAPSGGRTSSARTWNDLKPEAREALDRFIATTPGSTREGILKSAGDEYFKERR